MREAVAVAVACWRRSGPRSPRSATRDRPTLVFTVSGAYIDGVGPLVGGRPAGDRRRHRAARRPFRPDRSIKRTIGAGFSGTYYKGTHLGHHGRGFLLGLGYDDTLPARRRRPVARNIERCNSIEEQDRSAAAVTVVGGRGLPDRERRVHLALRPRRPRASWSTTRARSCSSAQASRRLAELIIYDDENTGTRLRPAFELGVGTTIAAGQGYQLRWEVRDNIVGIQARHRARPPAAAGAARTRRCTSTCSACIVGLDVILERQRGRRY